MLLCFWLSMVISVKMEGFQAQRKGASGARIMRRIETVEPIYLRFPFLLVMFNPRFEQPRSARDDLLVLPPVEPMYGALRIRRPFALTADRLRHIKMGKWPSAESGVVHGVIDYFTLMTVCTQSAVVTRD